MASSQRSEPARHNHDDHDGPQASLRLLPSVDALARAFASRAGEGETAPTAEAVTQAAREVIGAARAAVQSGGAPPAHDELLARLRERLETADRPHLKRVINLGRAPLSAAAVRALAEVARGYSNLEYDLEAGTRGSRQAHVRDLLRALTGAEDALAVNNNAAAVLVALAALAAGREVIVSRGELVEIGGGFRVPDVMRQSGARLVEVGTTNRTRTRDYAEAITAETALLLAVHPSNFRVVGFTETPPLVALAALARERGIALMYDLGSGSLGDTTRWGLAHEPTPQESIAAGADVVCFSGDKLLGGPQAGLIVGRATLLERIERHPLMRAVRIDKLTLAALEATLRQHARGVAEREVPVWRALAAPLAELRRRAEAWAEALRAHGLPAAAIEGESTIGGGSLPGETQPTVLCAIHLSDAAAAMDAGTLATRLRLGEPAVVARVYHDRLLLDPRTVQPSEDETLVSAVLAVARTHPGS
jgi:L-seryl-tRNA(Ser) seleniumtransferase